MTEHEMLEIMLFYCNVSKNTNEIAHRLLDKFGSLYNVCAASREELQKVKGVGLATANFLKILPEFTTAYRNSVYENDYVFNSIEEIADYCVNLELGKCNEVVYLLCFSAKYKLLKCVKLAEGTPGEVVIEPRRVIEEVVHSRTVEVVICHNHPGGNLTASQKDMETTAVIKRALDTIHVRLLCHVIVANGQYITLHTENS